MGEWELVPLCAHIKGGPNSNIPVTETSKGNDSPDFRCVHAGSAIILLDNAIAVLPNPVGG